MQAHVIIRQSGGTAKVAVSETRVYARGFLRSSGQWYGPWNLNRTVGCSTRTFYSRTSRECEGNPVSPLTGWDQGYDIKAVAQATIVVNGYTYSITGPTLNPWV